jgi:hypothetical protein
MKLIQVEYSPLLIFLALLLTAIVAVLSWSVASDLDDAEMQARTYCRNVHDKVWPDYQDTYNLYCTPTGEWNGR